MCESSYKRGVDIALNTTKSFLINNQQNTQNHNRISLYSLYCYMFRQGTAVAQWFRLCATNLEVAGSIPAGVIGIFHWHNPSDPTMSLRVDSASNRNEYQEYFLGVKATASTPTACAMPADNKNEVSGRPIHP